MTVPLFAIIAFMLAQLAIGIWVSRRIATEDDYLIAGRRLGYPLAIFSIFATWFGAETVIGAAGVTYNEGVSLSSSEPFGYGLCLIIMGVVFARPLWRRKLTTFADLFRSRFSPNVERLAAVILIPTSVLWAAAQVRAFGHILANASTLDVDAAITIAAAATVAYTVFGGLLVDAITDLIQGGLLVVGLLIILVAVVIQLGGPLAAAHAVVTSDRLMLGEFHGGFLSSLEAWAIPVLGSVLAAETIARVIATRTETVAQRSSIAAGVLYITVGAIPVFIAIVGAGVSVHVTEAEQMLPAVAKAILPTFAYGIFAGGLICAILSTVDSTLLVASGMLSHNLIVPAFGLTSERVKVALARGGVATFGVLAYILALRSESVFSLIEQSSALGSAGVLVAASFGLFTRWGGRRTAAATLVAGIVVYVGVTVAGLAYPFLASLLASGLTYLLGGVLEGSPGEAAVANPVHGPPGA
jgi:solute:Na+ symporter, SSS family